MSLRMDVVESFGSNSKASKKFRALQAGVAGTNKTLAPTPGFVRPTDPPDTPAPTYQIDTPVPNTPFPTEIVIPVSLFISYACDMTYHKFI